MKNPLDILKTEMYICEDCGKKFKGFKELEIILCEECFDEYQNAQADNQRY